MQTLIFCHSAVNGILRYGVTGFVDYELLASDVSTTQDRILTKAKTFIDLYPELAVSKSVPLLTTHPSPKPYR